MGGEKYVSNVLLLFAGPFADLNLTYCYKTSIWSRKPRKRVGGVRPSKDHVDDFKKYDDDLIKAKLGAMRVRVSEGQETFVERGGRPTLRELMRDVVFSPNSGTIRLNKERLILQRASHTSRLRDHLTERFGRDEAFTVLTRLGFTMGMEDADFVRQAWPSLDPGDVFTAGTRLHMLCGCVRLKTIHNDFDLRKGRFSGEFLWQGSVEATEHRRNHGTAGEPVCWSQVGYASGYASRCFGRLIVYKELECFGCGQEACRVLGKPAERWGEDDELVRLYQQEIAPAGWEGIGGARPSTRADRRDALKTLLLSPVLPAIEHIARFDMPLLVTGEPGTAKRLAARAWSEARFGADGPLDVVACDALGSEALDTLLDRRIAPAPGRRPKRSQRRIILTNVDLLTPFLQRRLARRLDEGDTRIAVTARLSLPELCASSDFDRSLLHRLAAATVAMPPLRTRRDHIPAIADLLLEAVARRHGVKKPALTGEAQEALQMMDLHGNVTELDAMVQGGFIGAQNGCIDGPLIREIAKRFVVPKLALPVDVPEVSESLVSSALTLNAINERMYHEAMAHHQGNVSAAARSLGITRPQLAYRLKRRT